MPEYRSAETVFVSPDSPQRPVRELVLRDGKRLVMATPKLLKGLVEIPKTNRPREAATIRGAIRHGRPVSPWSLKVDLIVEGSVAVDPGGGRLGKGGGFGDLEFAILKEARAVSDETPIATTIHDLQFVDHVPAEIHDVPVDLVVTPRRFVRVSKERQRAKPPGLLWELLDDRLLTRIPLLQELKPNKHIRSLP
jgi:5-formyltetrahydrofolate cyclo-ligase